MNAEPPSLRHQARRVVAAVPTDLAISPFLLMSTLGRICLVKVKPWSAVMMKVVLSSRPASRTALITSPTWRS